MATWVGFIFGQFHCEMTHFLSRIRKAPLIHNNGPVSSDASHISGYEACASTCHVLLPRSSHYSANSISRVFRIFVMGKVACSWTTEHILFKLLSTWWNGQRTLCAEFKEDLLQLCSAAIHFTLPVLDVRPICRCVSKLNKLCRENKINICWNTWHNLTVLFH